MLRRFLCGCWGQTHEAQQGGKTSSAEGRSGAASSATPTAASDIMRLAAGTSGTQHAGHGSQDLTPASPTGQAAASRDAHIVFHNSAASSIHAMEAVLSLLTKPGGQASQGASGIQSTAMTASTQHLVLPQTAPRVRTSQPLLTHAATADAEMLTPYAMTIASRASTGSPTIAFRFNSSQQHNSPGSLNSSFSMTSTMDHYSSFGHTPATPSAGGPSRRSQTQTVPGGAAARQPLLTAPAYTPPPRATSSIDEQHETEGVPAVGVSMPVPGISLGASPITSSWLPSPTPPELAGKNLPDIHADQGGVSLYDSHPNAHGAETLLGAVPLQLLGAGEHSLVYSGTWHTAPVAIKYVLVDQLAPGASEAVLGPGLVHPNVLQCFESRVLKLAQHHFENTSSSNSKHSGGELSVAFPGPVSASLRAVSVASDNFSGSPSLSSMDAHAHTLDNTRGPGGTRSAAAASPAAGAGQMQSGGSAMSMHERHEDSSTLQGSAAAMDRWGSHSGSAGAKPSSARRTPRRKSDRHAEITPSAPRQESLEGLLVPHSSFAGFGAGTPESASSMRLPWLSVQKSTPTAVAARAEPATRSSTAEKVHDSLDDLSASANANLDEAISPIAAARSSRSHETPAWLPSILHMMKARPQQYLTEIVSELCDRGTLKTAVLGGAFNAATQPGGSSRRAAMLALVRTAKEVAQGMSHLHACHVLHADLKPDNILLRSSGADARGFLAKVSDFGLSRLANLQTAAHATDTSGMPGLGSMSYQAPEALHGMAVRASDVWSFGILMHYMVTGGMPAYPGLRMVQVMMGVMEGSINPTWPPHVFKPIQKLGTLCLMRDPVQRPSFRRIVAALEQLEAHLTKPGHQPGHAPQHAHLSSGTTHPAAVVAGAAVGVGASGSSGGTGGSIVAGGSFGQGSASLLPPGIASTLSSHVSVGSGHGSGVSIWQPVYLPSRPGSKGVTHPAQSMPAHAVSGLPDTGSSHSARSLNLMPINVASQHNTSDSSHVVASSSAAMSTTTAGPNGSLWHGSQEGVSSTSLPFYGTGSGDDAAAYDVGQMQTQLVASQDPLGSGFGTHGSGFAHALLGANSPHGYMGSLHASTATHLSGSQLAAVEEAAQEHALDEAVDNPPVQQQQQQQQLVPGKGLGMVAHPKRIVHHASMRSNSSSSMLQHSLMSLMSSGVEVTSVSQSQASVDVLSSMTPSASPVLKTTERSERGPIRAPPQEPQQAAPSMAGPSSLSLQLLGHAAGRRLFTGSLGALLAAGSSAGSDPPPPVSGFSMRSRSRSQLPGMDSLENMVAEAHAAMHAPPRSGSSAAASNSRTHTQDASSSSASTGISLGMKAMPTPAAGLHSGTVLVERQVEDEAEVMDLPQTMPKTNAASVLIMGELLEAVRTASFSAPGYQGEDSTVKDKRVAQ